MIMRPFWTPNAAVLAGPLVATYRGAGALATDQSAGTPYSFSRTLVIPGTPDRYVVVFVAMIATTNTNTAMNVSTVTVDGVPLASIAQHNSRPGSSIVTAMFGGIVNTPNISVNIAITHTGAQASGCCIAYYTIEGSETVAPVWQAATAYTNGDANLGTHTLVEGECMIFFGHHFGNTSTFGWTGAVEKNELNYDSRAYTSSAQRDNVGSATTSFTSSGGDGVYAYAKFAPAP